MKLDEPFSLAPETDEYPVSPLAAAPTPSEGIYVTLPDVAGLKCLPRSGTITFQFKREEVSLRGEDDLSARLCLCSVVDVTCDPEAEAGTDAVDSLFAEVAKEEEGEED